MGRGATSRGREEAGSAVATADGAGGGGGSDGLELAAGVADPVAVGEPADWKEGGLWAPAGSKWVEAPSHQRHRSAPSSPASPSGARGGGESGSCFSGVGRGGDGRLADGA